MSQETNLQKMSNMFLHDKTLIHKISLKNINSLKHYNIDVRLLDSYINNNLFIKIYFSFNDGKIIYSNKYQGVLYSEMNSWINEARYKNFVSLDSFFADKLSKDIFDNEDIKNIKIVVNTFFESKDISILKNYTDTFYSNKMEDLTHKQMDFFADLSNNYYQFVFYTDRDTPKFYIYEISNIYYLYFDEELDTESKIFQVSRKDAFTIIDAFKGCIKSY